MRALLPMPWHSIMLTLVWMLLNGFSYGHLVLGAFLGWLIPVLTHTYVRGHPPVRHPGKMLLYILRLLKDIVTANIDVARRVLMPNRLLKPGWLQYPLSMSEAFPATVLASSVSLTPGTVSVEFSADRRYLFIHVLHLEDADALTDFIRTRYEQPLKEIFEC